MDNIKMLNLILIAGFLVLAGCFDQTSEGSPFVIVDTDDDGDCILNLVEMELGLDPEDNDSDNDSYLDTYDRFPLDPLQYKSENESFIRSSCIYEGEAELTESGEVDESNCTNDPGCSESNEIGGKVTIVTGWVSNNENNNSSFNLVWELAAGSEPIWEDGIEWDITCNINSTNGSASGNFVETMDLLGDAGLENLSNLALLRQTHMINLRTSFDSGNGCPITSGEEFNLQILVIGGGSTLETLQINDITIGSTVV